MAPPAIVAAEQDATDEPIPIIDSNFFKLTLILSMVEIVIVLLKLIVSLSKNMKLDSIILSHTISMWYLHQLWFVSLCLPVQNI